MALHTSLPHCHQIQCSHSSVLKPSMAPLFLGWNTNFWKAGKVLGALFSAQQLKLIPNHPPHSFPLLHQKLHTQGENFVLHNVLGTPSPCWLVKSCLRSGAFYLTPSSRSTCLISASAALCAPRYTDDLTVKLTKLTLGCMGVTGVNFPTPHSQKSTQNFWLPQPLRAYCWPKALPITKTGD